MDGGEAEVGDVLYGRINKNKKEVKDKIDSL